MTAYAIAYLRSVDLNEQVADYLRRIDETLVPCDGAFLVHGTEHETVEGDLPGAIIVIGFPDLARARGWYDSPAYRAILPLRTDNSEGVALLVDGVPPGYRAASYLQKVGAAAR